MDEQELRRIIALILDAIEEARRPKKALVVFTGALLGFETSLEALRELKASGLHLTGMMSTGAENVLDKAKINELGLDKPTMGLISSHDLLLVPTCTVNTVAKVACGIADSLATNLISEFISFGKPVVAASTAADPDSSAKKARFPLMPAAQARLMRDNLNRVRALGVKFCEVEDLAGCVRTVLSLGRGPSEKVADTPTPPSQQPLPDRLIAAHHIQSLPEGSILVVRGDAVVTHMATDLAHNRSIRIERA